MSVKGDSYKQKVYNNLKDHKWGEISNTQISSWLLWDKELEDIDKHPEKISTKCVFVALNASFAEEGKWNSFHSNTSKSDQNLKAAFESSKFKGSYITDLIKFKSFDEKGNPKERCVEPKSEDAMHNIGDEVYIYNRNVDLFLEELELFNIDTEHKPPVLMAFGDAVYKMLLFNPNINEKYEIRKIPHFSARYYSGQREGRCYKTAVEKILNSEKEKSL